VKSFTGYGFLTSQGKYRIVLNTDNPAFGGFGLIDDTVEHFTIHDPLYAGEGKEWLKLYLPARTAMVLQKIYL
jgi:1,4-alpha-glucan branching enzyme